MAYVIRTFIHSQMEPFSQSTIQVFQFWHNLCSKLTGTWFLKLYYFSQQEKTTTSEPTTCKYKKYIIARLSQLSQEYISDKIKTVAYKSLNIRIYRCSSYSTKKTLCDCQSLNEGCVKLPIYNIQPLSKRYCLLTRQDVFICQNKLTSSHLRMFTLRLYNCRKLLYVNGTTNDYIQ